MNRSKLLKCMFYISIPLVFLGTWVVDLFVLGLFIIFFKEIKGFRSVYLMLCSAMFLLFVVAADINAEVSINGVFRNCIRYLSIIVLSLIVCVLDSQQQEKIWRNILILVFFSIIGSLLNYSAALDSNVLWRHGFGEVISWLALLFALSFNRSKHLSTAICVGLFLVNIFLDFRTMALFSILILALLHYKAFVRSSPSVKMIIGVIALFFVFTVVIFYQSNSKGNERRETSNTMRLAMIIHVLEDLGEMKVLGSGYKSFQRDFEIPDVDNAGLIEKIDQKGGGLPIHGYLFILSYESGVVCFFVWVLFVFKGASLLVRTDVPDFEKAIIIYFILGCFLFTLSQFDRYLAGLAIGLLFRNFLVGRRSNISD